MSKTFLSCIAILWCSLGYVFAQEAGEEKKDPEKAFIRIINATTVVLKEPWKSGVDLAFKDQKLAMDIRGGEAASYKQIVFTGKDTVEARMAGQTSVIGTVPATFARGGFYSLYLTGQVNEAGFKVSPLVVQDFPTPPTRVRKGYGWVGVFNAISTFPVKLQVDGKTPMTLQPLSFTEMFLEPGTHPYRLIFPYKTSERDMQGFFIVAGGSEYNAVVFASPEKPDRPSLRFLDNSAAKGDAEEALKAAQDEEKNQSVGGGTANTQ